MDRSPIGRLDYDDDSKRQAGVVLRSSEAYLRRQSSLFALSRRKQGKILGTETRRTIANAEGRHDLGREACYSVASCNSFSIRITRLRLFCTRTFATGSAAKVRELGSALSNEQL